MGKPHAETQVVWPSRTGGQLSLAGRQPRQFANVRELALEIDASLRDLDTAHAGNVEFDGTTVTWWAAR